MSTRFDPARAVKFDLTRGSVTDPGGACVLVPSSALLELCDSAGAEAVKSFGRGLGTELGRRVQEKVGANATIPELVEHLGGHLALTGLGSLSVERWGKALVVNLESSPGAARGDALVAAVLEGAIQRAFGRDVACVRLHRDAETARFVIVAPDVSAKVQSWVQDGAPWGDALARLHGASA